MHILVVDDEKKIADTLTMRLQLRGFDASPAYDAASALSELDRISFQGIILDLRLPDMDGIEVLGQIKRMFPAMRVVILSGHANEKDFETCLELGAIACFHKPAKISELIEALVGLSDGNLKEN
jgi:DNA-binding response OmpR family regulator